MDRGEEEKLYLVIFHRVRFFIHNTKRRRFARKQKRLEKQSRDIKFRYYKTPDYYKAYGENEIVERAQRLIEVLKEKKHSIWSEKAAIIVINQLLDFLDSIYEV